MPAARALQHRSGTRGRARSAARARTDRGRLMTERELLPSAGRLMTSLRDIGYDVTGAIADLVDNSIDACAKHIEVRIVCDGDDSRILVIDDGLGMTERTLNEAMR